MLIRFHNKTRYLMRYLFENAYAKEKKNRKFQIKLKIYKKAKIFIIENVEGLNKTDFLFIYFIYIAFICFQENQNCSRAKSAVILCNGCWPMKNADEISTFGIASI